MKIGPVDNKPPVAPVAGERPGPAAARPNANGGEPSAQVELSATAALLGNAAGGDFDAAKVERIAQAIRNGTFRVDAEAIADKLIANAQELLGRSTG